LLLNYYKEHFNSSVTHSSCHIFTSDFCIAGPVFIQVHHSLFMISGKWFTDISKLGKSWRNAFKKYWYVDQTLFDLWSLLTILLSSSSSPPPPPPATVYRVCFSLVSRHSYFLKGLSMSLILWFVMKFKFWESEIVHVVK